MFFKRLITCTVLLACFYSQVLLASSDEKEQQAVLDQKIKLKTLKAIKDASKLIEDVGYPEISRLKVFLIHGSGKYFSLQKISVIVDGVDKADFIYNELQQKALQRGGGNRVYIGTVTEGIHEVVFVFEGKTRKNTIIKKAETWLFDKKPGEVVVVVKVRDNESTLRPDFEFKMIKGQL